LVQNNLAYLAGIVDGEGYFFLEQARKNYKIPVLGVEMAEKDVIQAFPDCFGCGHFLTRQPKQAHHKLLYRWRVRGRPAIAILKKMYKYFSIRRRKNADILFKHKFKNGSKKIISRNISQECGVVKSP
jgi:hypothetical protein|tara:strand:- start:164 stop:547 length:384 start_codon:yes stop_codon:yes gene_type:complete